MQRRIWKKVTVSGFGSSGANQLKERQCEELYRIRFSQISEAKRKNYPRGPHSACREMRGRDRATSHQETERDSGRWKNIDIV